MWNPCYGDKKGTINVCLDIPAEDEEKYCLVKKTVDENTCNPLKAWHELGEPAALTAEQKETVSYTHLDVYKRQPTVERRTALAATGRASFHLVLKPP